MQLVDGRFIYSASDLNNFVECRELTQLERLAALGQRERPKRDDPMTELIARKGEEHEQRHLGRLLDLSRSVVCIERGAHSFEGFREAEARTMNAMDEGAEYIYQATFFDGNFLGHADFLRRVDLPGERRAWTYEVIDTKLALHPKPYYLVQLCNYSEHLARIDDVMPEYASIILGSGEERRFKLSEYSAYYRHVKQSFLESVEGGAETYPLECAHCAICPWNAFCAKRRDDDDHLSLVAGVRRDQVAKLESAGIKTLAQLAAAQERPEKMPERSFANVRAQAAQQHKHREALRNGQGRKHFYAFRPPADELSGFAKLPAPSPGDIFFDIEGDPLYRADRGLEYLWGFYLPGASRYDAFWALEPADERAAFERFVDFVVQRLREYPDAHVYHYAAYEISALKRLMGRFATREREVDDFLRRGVFVDLYAIVRQSMWLSQASYSIKKVEAFYGLERTGEIRGGDESIVMFESWIASREPSILESIRAYNEDDCRSTFALRTWLVERRDELNAQLQQPLPWRSVPQVATAEETDRTPLEAQLLDGLPAPDSDDELRNWNETLRGRWLLGNLLQFYRREAKPEWWHFFERCANPQDLQEFDDEAIGGLVWRRDAAPYKLGDRDRNLVYAFDFPAQEHRLPLNGSHDPYTGKWAGEIIKLDNLAGRLQLKLASALQPEQLRALIPGGPVPDKNKRKAFERIAQAYVDGTLSSAAPATLDLLLGRKPRAGGKTLQPPAVTKETVSGVVQRLERSYVFAQGPPGSGKTTIGAWTIVDLLQAGKRIGVMAQSHKAVHNLLRKIEQTAMERGVRFRGCHKEVSTTEGSAYAALEDWPMIDSVGDIAALAAEDCRLAAGTTFAWADQRLTGFDYLFIDEAGQVSLADALIGSMAAHNVVLLGDPMQLPQVTKGSHPAGTGVSILEHLLGDRATVPSDEGIFLDTSYRMHPAICSFISDAIYDSRLRADSATGGNAIDSPGLKGSGLAYMPIMHQGNARRSDEESERVVEEIAKLLCGTVTLGNQPRRALRESDILVVAPYNSQRIRIRELLEAAGYGGVQVGTVDKFQGQEAPVVFYSMATSSAETLPRDAAFLFDKNRFNVAISRAQCMSVIVCSPQLLDAPVRTPEQIALVNLLCAYVEAAQPLEAIALPG